jgi:hypothetical protein
VECCPTPLQWLYEVAGYWWELEHAVLHVSPEHPKRAQWLTRLMSMQAMEELGHFQLQLMLKHEMMTADEWHVNGPQDLVTVSLCIQIAIDKMQLRSLSVAYACRS